MSKIPNTKNPMIRGGFVGLFDVLSRTDEVAE
jgi:hypothetical protein